MTTFNTFVKTSVISAVALMSLAGAGPAFAASTDEGQVPQAMMSSYGTDFTSPAAVKQLQKKASRVAKTICYGDDDPIHATSSQQDCYATAIKTAFAQIETKRQIALGTSSGTLVASQSLHSTVRTAH